mmetsp:Transcript_40115/g.73313  ORF Transcript_40115/g.73313 Transcript_40115/m.73313 type:complete len:91 (-) Transcript_40115:306-578(-)
MRNFICSDRGVSAGWVGEEHSCSIFGGLNNSPFADAQPHLVYPKPTSTTTTLEAASAAKIRCCQLFMDFTWQDVTSSHKAADKTNSFTKL